MNIERQLMDEPRAIPSDADLMTLDEWRASLKAGAFNAYDGHGYWAAGGFMDLEAGVWNDVGYPTPPPDWATHVAWFNK